MTIAFICTLLILDSQASIPPLKKKTAIDSLEEVLQKPLSDTDRINTLITLSIKLKNRKTPASLTVAKEALRLCDATNNLEKKRIVLNAVGNAYQGMADYNQALAQYFQALKICDDLKKSDGYRFYAWSNIGNCYINLHQDSIAKKYYFRILASQRFSISDTSILVDTYNNLAAIEKNKDSALAYYFHAMSLCRDQEKKGLLFLNIGLTHFKSGNKQLAANYFKEAFPYIKDLPRGVIAYYNCLGDLYAEEGNFRRAEEYYLKAKSEVDSSALISALPDVYKGLVDLYEKEHNYERAYFYQKLYKELGDSILNEHTSQRLAEMQKSFEIENRDNEILLLNQKQQIAEGSSNRQKLIIVLLLMTALATAAFSRNIILKQRMKNKSLNEEKALIEKDNSKLLHENTEAKYEVLKSKTNPHFLFNSLSTLSAIVAKDKDLSLMYIRKFAELYRLILTTGDHKVIRLSEEMEIVNNYLYLQSMRFKSGLEIAVNVDTDASRYFIPPFSIQMAVENAIKHNIISSSRKLTISIESTANEIIISNNLQRKHTGIASTSTGQKNTINRYELLTDILPVYAETETSYTVKLPLLQHSERHKSIS